MLIPGPWEVDKAFLLHWSIQTRQQIEVSKVGTVSNSELKTSNYYWKGMTSSQQIALHVSAN